jgi:hypothetical protein
MDGAIRLAGSLHATKEEGLTPVMLSFTNFAVAVAKLEYD